MRGFYEGLHAALNSKFFIPHIASDFHNYQKILSSGLKLSGINFDFAFNKDTLDDLKEKIQQWIFLTGKKIVILIDDIDRLQKKDDVLLVFKIVKLAARFKNVIFVLSFDPGVVLSHFKNEVSHDPSFLDKIIQAPIHLPSVDQAIINKYFYYPSPNEGHYSAIDRLLLNLKIDDQQKRKFHEEFSHLYGTHIMRLFPTIRTVKRYLNALYTTLPSIANEIDLYDYFCIEIVRVFHPAVYADIWAHSWYYIEGSVKNGSYFISPFWMMALEKKSEKIKDHIEILIENESDSDVLLEILKSIFINVNTAFNPGPAGIIRVNYRSEKRIMHPDVFPKYFMLKVPTGDMPDAEIEDIISNWNDSDDVTRPEKIQKIFIAFRKDKRIFEFLTKLTIFISSMSAESAKGVIRHMIDSTSAFSLQRIHEYHSSELDRAISLMLNLINEKIDNVEIESYLMEAITQSQLLEFAVSIVDDCRTASGGLFNIYSNVDIERLQQALSKRLNNHFVVMAKNIFEENKSSFNYILIQWSSGSDEDRKKVNDYVFSLIDQNPSYLPKVIDAFIRNWGGSRPPQLRYDDMVQIYDQVTLFAKAKRYAEMVQFNQEDKSIIDSFIKAVESNQNAEMKKIKQEANQLLFIEVLSEGRAMFRDGKYLEASIGFNRALSLIDLPDQNNKAGQVKHDKWRCLLELAWNNGSPDREFFDEACKLASNETQLNIFVGSRYPDGLADKAPIEFYFCLFYYLKWHFAERKTEKDNALESFDNHMTLATTGGVSGRSDELDNRCKILAEKISA